VTATVVGPGRRQRAGIGIVFLVLFLFALGVFLLPFAFPTEGAIVARFASTAEFSPNTPGGRATAGVAIQMRDPGRLTLTVMQGSQLVRTLIPTRSVRKGWITTAWDGTNQQGLAMPDGVYTLHLMASSGKKGYNVSRRATIDRTRPAAPTVIATSADPTSLAPGAQCAITVTPSTYARFNFGVGNVPHAQPIGGPQFVDKGTAFVWNWNGRTAHGGIVTPGFYPVAVTEVSVNGFTFTAARECWIGNLLGSATPTNLAPGDTAQVKLTTPTRVAVPAATPVTLGLYRRTGTPGAPGHVIGPEIGAPVATTAGSARIQLPAGIPVSGVWIEARAGTSVALVAAGARP
jgi:FlgD Ig-like domain